jgi:hypothetical protein
MKNEWGKRASSLVIRNGPSALLFIICTMIPTVLFSYLINKPDENDKLSALDNFISSVNSGEFTRSLIILWSSIALTILLTYLFAKRQHKQIMRLSVSSNNKRIAWTSFISILTIVAIVAMTFSLGGSFDSLKKHAGGFFDITLGFFSLAGIYLTLAEVVDIRNSIVSFRDLLNRIEALIIETPEDDQISMLVLTPAMGCMVLPFREWNRIGELIKSQDHNISLTCLTDKEMSKWFESYKLSDETADDTKNKDDRIKAGLDSSNSIIAELNRKSKTLPGHEPPVMGSFENFSRAYLIANRVRAIVAVPLYMPTPTYQPIVEDHYSKRVQFIGFETQDFHLIESITEEIKMRRGFFSTTANNTSSTPSANSAIGIGSAATISTSDATEIGNES